MTDATEVTHRVNDATFAAWNARDVDAVAAVYAEDVVSVFSGVDLIEVGRDAAAGRAGDLISAVPDLRVAHYAVVVEGRQLAVRWLLYGTHQGEYLGIPATGNGIRIEGASFRKLNAAGEVAEDLHHVDFTTLFRQLGLP